MKNPVGWFEIYVDDMARAKAFYESVLGTSFEALTDPINSGTEMWSFVADFESYGSSGALVKMDGVSPGGTGTMVYFACEDCAVEESRVVAAGGQVMQSKFSIAEFGFCSMVMDSEGNRIGLHSDK